MAEFKIVARQWQPQDLIDDLQMMIDKEPDSITNGRRTTLCMARDYLKDFFATDAVKVVRCKQCVHSKWSKKNKKYYCQRRWAMHGVRERDFCSYGKRRDNDA